MAKQQAKQTAPTTTQKPNFDEGERSGVSSSRNEPGDAEEDQIYGLASVLYHSLQGVSAARKYVEDARRAGADELLEFFEECRSEAEARAKQAKSLLIAYSEEEDEEASEGDEDEAGEGDENEAGEGDEDDDEDDA